MKDDDQTVYDHVFDTYISLRTGMAWIAFLFPLLVIGVGFVADSRLGLQDSLSAYYWATNTGFNPSRIVFVGGLFAIAAFLYLYKGFTPLENMALNAAGAFAIGVACFPMKWTCDDCGKWTPHGFFAVSLFACLVYVVSFRAKDTLKYLPKGIDPKPFKRKYLVATAFMAAAPLIALFVTMTIGEKKFVIAIEIAGIWAFSYYWRIKGKELSLSHATKKALDMTLPVPPNSQMDQARLILLEEQSEQQARFDDASPSIKIEPSTQSHRTTVLSRGIR